MELFPAGRHSAAADCSVLVKPIAFCQATSNYLNQCWILVSKMLFWANELITHAIFHEILRPLFEVIQRLTDLTITSIQRGHITGIGIPIIKKSWSILIMGIPIPGKMVFILNVHLLVTHHKHTGITHLLYTVVHQSYQVHPPPSTHPRIGAIQGLYSQSDETSCRQI